MFRTLARRQLYGRKRKSWRQEWQALPGYLKVAAGATAVGGGVFVLSHVEEIPESGRKRLMFLSRAAEKRLGEQAYQQIIHSEQLLPASHPITRAVRRVGERIKATSSADMNWSFDVIDNKTPNAFCLPSGRIFVYSGLFQVLHNEDALAAVLFHEAAHGLARHGAEKVSFSMLLYTLLAIFVPDYGQWSDLLVKVAIDLPFSRKLEMEADAIGLDLMAKACYNPRASIQMNMALGKLDKSNGHFKYFSTHPPSQERVQALKHRLGHAQMLYDDNCHELQDRFWSSVRPFQAR